MSQGKAEAEALLAEIVQGSPTVYEKIEGSEGTFRVVDRNQLVKDMQLKIERETREGNMEGVFSQQLVVGFHISRMWRLKIDTGGVVEWSHETYTDDPADGTEEDTFITVAGTSRLINDGGQLEVKFKGEEGVLVFVADVENSGTRIKVAEESTPSGDTCFAGNRELKLVKQVE